MALSLMQDVLKKTSGEKPSKIIISVGADSGIDIDFLRHSFEEHILPERNWKNVQLKFEEEGLSLLCCGCGKKILESSSFSCPFCGSDDMEISGGHRVYVKEVIL